MASILKLDMEKRGGSTEHGPTAGPCFFERMGDNLHHLLPFLEVPSLCRLDAAMTSREGRETVWLPRLTGLANAMLVLDEVDKLHEVYTDQPGTLVENAAAWLDALRWLIARGVPMPEMLFCPRGCDASQFTACFEHCSTAASVRHISMQCCSGTPTAAGMMHLQRCTGLTGLNLDGLTEDEAVWEQLDAQNWTCFNTLEKVRSFSPVSIVTAEIWGRRLSALVSISIQYRDDGSLEHLCRIKTLKDVTLAFSGEETAEGFAIGVHLSKLPALRSLTLDNSNFIDAVLEHIKVPSLRELEVRFSDISAAGIALIAARFQLLEKLSIDFCGPVTDADLAVLSRLTSLQQLCLCSQRDLTGAGIAHLRGLACLQDLRLDDSNITSQSLAVIGSLTELRKLSLDHCEGLFSDDSATVRLKNLTNLTSLDVRQSGFTVVALDSLHSAANLDTLILGGRYSDEDEWLIAGPALERLVAASTKLKVLEFDELEVARSMGIVSPTLEAILKARGIELREHQDY